MIAFLEAILHILIVTAASDDKGALHLPRNVPHSSTPEVRFHMCTLLLLESFSRWRSRKSSAKTINTHTCVSTRTGEGRMHIIPATCLASQGRRAFIEGLLTRNGGTCSRGTQQQRLGESCALAAVPQLRAAICQVHHVWSFWEVSRVILARLPPAFLERAVYLSFLTVDKKLCLAKEGTSLLTCGKGVCVTQRVLVSF